MILPVHRIVIGRKEKITVYFGSNTTEIVS